MPVKTISSLLLLLLALAGVSHSLTAAAARETVEVDIEVLTGIDYEEGKPLPKKVTKYDGRTVVIGGYMHSSTKRNTDTFLMVGNLCQCSGTPMVQHFIEVTLDGTTTDPKPGYIEIEGTLSVGEETDGGFVTSIYRVKGDFF